MRNIITLVFIMFIAGYSFNLEKRGNIGHSNISHRYPSQSDGKNIFTAMLVKYPHHNETSHENLMISDMDLLQYCAADEQNFQNSLPSTANKVSASDTGRQAFRHSLLDISDSTLTLATFRTNSKHDFQIQTDSMHRNSSI